MINITSIYRYPVKGLSPQQLEETELSPGKTLNCDRIYAIENGPGRFDKKQPRFVPKINFLMLMKNEKLAALKTTFDETDHTLTILRSGKEVTRGSLKQKIGRQLIEQFFSAYLEDELKGPPQIMFSENHNFTDIPEKSIHIVNLNTVRDLERAIGKTVDPLRFRANIYIDGLPAWEEWQWIEKSIRIGDTELSVFKKTRRCDATNVDPETGIRDLTIPRDLMRHYNHSDFGIQAMVNKGGKIKSGDPIELV